MSEAHEENPVSQDLQSTTWAICILLAWEAGELTEGQVVKAFGIDRQRVRECRQQFIAAGLRLVQEDAQMTHTLSTAAARPAAGTTS